MNDYEEVKINNNSYKVPKDNETLNLIVASGSIKKYMHSIVLVNVFWGTIYLLLSLIGFFDIIFFVLSVILFSYAYILRKRHTVKLLIGDAIIIFAIAVFNILFAVLNSELSVSYRVVWSIITLIQIVYSIQIILFYKSNKNIQIDDENDNIYRELRKFFNEVIKTKSNKVSSLLKFVCYGAGTRIYKTFLANDKVFIINVNNKDGYVCDLKDFEINMLKKKMFQGKYDVKIITPYENYKAVMSYDDYDKYKKYTKKRGNMTNIWEKKGITPEKIKNGKIEYSINDFARDFKPILEKDIAGVKSIDHNPKGIKRVMYDIFLFLANAPLIKQDIRAASKHYGIPSDQIQVYLDKYCEEDEILLTIIDIEYERLLKKYGERNTEKITADLHEIISEAAKIFYP